MKTVLFCVLFPVYLVFGVFLTVLMLLAAICYRVSEWLIFAISLAAEGAKQTIWWFKK